MDGAPQGGRRDAYPAVVEHDFARVRPCVFSACPRPPRAAFAASSTLLALGDRLLANEKLRELARMVGTFREFARGARRQRFERCSSEVHSVGQGADLSRLLPTELGMLRHPVLCREFKRRFVEGQLLEYAVRGEDKAGRGPMVVCIDGSGSMAGAKELWAKAVTLALADIARLERRQCRAIIFSGGHSDLGVFDLLGPLSPSSPTFATG